MYLSMEQLPNVSSESTETGRKRSRTLLLLKRRHANEWTPVRDTSNTGQSDDETIDPRLPTSSSSLQFGEESDDATIDPRNIQIKPIVDKKTNPARTLSSKMLNAKDLTNYIRWLQRRQKELIDEKTSLYEQNGTLRETIREVESLLDLFGESIKKYKLLATDPDVGSIVDSDDSTVDRTVQPSSDTSEIDLSIARLEGDQEELERQKRKLEMENSILRLMITDAEKIIDVVAQSIAAYKKNSINSK